MQTNSLNTNPKKKKVEDDLCLLTKYTYIKYGSKMITARDDPIAMRQLHTERLFHEDRTSASCLFSSRSGQLCELF
jgi:hypothetical protein